MKNATEMLARSLLEVAIVAADSLVRLRRILAQKTLGQQLRFSCPAVQIFPLGRVSSKALFYILNGTRTQIWAQ